MSQNKYYITIESAHSGYYKVDLEDHYGNYTQIYEKTVEEAMNYAKNWCKQADEREEANKIHSKAIQAMQKLDKKAGILTGNYDGLD